MRCPNCHSEMANQQTCPYCGAVNPTVYGVKTSPYGVATQPVNEQLFNQAPPFDKRLPKKTHKDLDAKLLLILVLQGGNFLLTMLLLIVFALK